MGHIFGFLICVKPLNGLVARGIFPTIPKCHHGGDRAAASQLTFDLKGTQHRTRKKYQKMKVGLNAFTPWLLLSR